MDRARLRNFSRLDSKSTEEPIYSKNTRRDEQTENGKAISDVLGWISNENFIRIHDVVRSVRWT